MQTFFYILLAIVILLLMIVIHEFGHYLAGKILKFKINEFSVGFGPKIFSKSKKNGEVFSLRAIPLGGYCAFEGEEDNEEPAKDPVKKDEVFQELAEPPAFAPVAPQQEQPSAEKINKPLTFNQQKPWKRIIVLISGALFNFISAIIFSFIYISVVGFAVPTVSEVYKDDTGAFYNELTQGDVITAVGGVDIGIMNPYEELMQGYKLGDEIQFSVNRGGEVVSVKATVKKINAENEEYDGLGFKSTTSFMKVNFGKSLLYAVPFTGKLSWSILGTFGQLITGKIPLSSMTGPVGTIGTIATYSQMNWRNILMLLPLIASNLAIFNLLPIPALDGSKVVFGVIEWIRGKPLNRKVENIIHFVGLIVLFSFVILVDIFGLFSRGCGI